MVLVKYFEVWWAESYWGRMLCGLLSVEQTDVFNGWLSCCRRQQRVRCPCMHELPLIYTCLMPSCLSTGGIIYNSVLLNSGIRRTQYCREYISTYEESPETGHFMDQQEPQILKWVESCPSEVCSPSASASARGKMALNAAPASVALPKKYLRSSAWTWCMFDLSSSLPRGLQSWRNRFRENSELTWCDLKSL